MPAILATGILPLSSSAQGLAEKKPMNVLFIASDDLNSDMNTFGDQYVKTPNLDRLAKMGVVFTRAYNQSPLCGPSRASIMTGYRPDKTQVHDLQAHFRDALPNAVTIPQMFKNNGYYTCRIGKIFHAGVPSDIGKPGSDDPASWTEAFNPLGKDKTDEHKITIVSKDMTNLGGALAYMATEGSDDELTDGISANMALKIIRDRKGKNSSLPPKVKEQPFFMAVGFYRPHCPFVAPKKYFDMYPLNTIKLPENPKNDWDNKPEAAKSAGKLFWGLTEQESKEVIRSYYASISFMDAQVGKLIDGLQEMGLLENTIVVFWSDQGYMLTHHGQWEKQTLFEHTATQPLLIYAPGKTSGANCNRIVETIDIYPTLAELSGLTPPSDLDGKSLVPLLKNPEMEWNYPAYTQQARTINPNVPPGEYKYTFNPILKTPDGKPAPFTTIFGRSVRVERYRYTEWDGGTAGKELYDYQTDPNEFVNLANDPKFKQLQQELADKLHAIEVK
jgi:uncharacterized sulfatase